MEDVKKETTTWGITRNNKNQISQAEGIVSAF